MLPKVNVRLTNRNAIFDCDPDTQLLLKEHFKYAVPGAKFSNRFQIGAWDGMRCLMSHSKVGVGLYLSIQQPLSLLFDFAITDMREFPKYRNISAQEATRPYQEEAVAALVKASNCGGIMLSATGTGKTF